MWREAGRGEQNYGQMMFLKQSLFLKLLSNIVILFFTTGC